jgi:hypothetical protein
MSAAKLNFSINPKAIKDRLANGGGGKSKINYLKLLPNKKVNLRLVPFKEGNDLGIAVAEGCPIIELRQYYGLRDYFPGKYKNIYSPSSFDEEDPIKNKYFEMRKQFEEEGKLDIQEYKDFLSPLESKSRYFSFVLLETPAGNELKLWSYPYGTFKSIMDILSDPDTYGDILDPENGHSLIVTMGSDNRTSVSVKPKATVLTEDDIDTILNQPSLEGYFKYESYEVLEDILNRYLETDVDVEDGDDEDEYEEDFPTDEVETFSKEEDESDDTEEEEEEEAPVKSKNNEFKKLFEQKKKK